MAVMTAVRESDSLKQLSGNVPVHGILANLLFASSGVHRVAWRDANFC